MCVYDAAFDGRALGEPLQIQVLGLAPDGLDWVGLGYGPGIWIL